MLLALPGDDFAVALDTPVRVIQELTQRGYNADREAVTLLANADDPAAAIEQAVAALPDDELTLKAPHIRDEVSERSTNRSPTAANPQAGGETPVETKGLDTDPVDEATGGLTAGASVAITNDITGQSTGTGVYEDFVATFRDRFERLSGLLRSRVNHRPTSSLGDMPGGSEAAAIGMVSDIRSTANGHWLIELEDTTGTFPTLVTKDREFTGLIDELLLDEVIAVEGTLADDAGILFVDALHFPDIPRTFQPTTADRHVQAALISDLHVGSEEFRADAWQAFADWLHTDEAAAVEYLLIGGDMVEGVGIYPGQDEELAIMDIYDQYAAFSEELKAVPGDIEIVMIPGNHDAVRLAEPQPAFTEDLRDIMSAHDAEIVGNPSVVTLEEVSILIYHGVSLDELIAEIPSLSYDDPHEAMYRLLQKRHVAPQFGERTRVAPEKRDYLVIDDVPDVFHAGHVHKLGVGRYRNVTVINSACWQAQTAFQRRVDIDPDAGLAPILDLDTLDVTVRSF